MMMCIKASIKPLAWVYKRTWCVSRAGLEDDQYVRQIDGYLPTSEVAFIDEIFKANSAILNALLTLLNERLFDNGNQRLRVPLLCLVSLAFIPSSFTSPIHGPCSGTASNQ